MTFTPEDLASGERYKILGPAYFAAQRIANELFDSDRDVDWKEPIQKVVEHMTLSLREALVDKMMGDVKMDIEHRIRGLVEQHRVDIVAARSILSGEIGGNGNGIAAWNDAQERTIADVLAAFEKAEKKARDWHI